MTETDKPLRRIHSFVRRSGRLTAGQQRSMDTHWPTMGLDPGDTLLDLDAEFGRSAPRVLEIGLGMGDALAEMAAKNPENDYIGVEVHRPGVGRVLGLLGERGCTNTRIFCHDAVDILKLRIADESLDRILVFFPDPWHKTRHNKRRLIQPEFVQLLRAKLKLGGILHLATDWEDYALQMMRVLSDAEGFSNTEGEGQYAPRPEYRPITKFEKRGQRLGHGIWDLLFERNK